MAFRLPFMKGKFSKKERTQMQIIHHLYRTILEIEPNSTDSVLALQDRNSFTKPLQNPEVSTDFDGMAEIRRLKRHGTLRELVITILPRICEWQRATSTGALTGFANEPMNLLLEEFKIWLRSLADKLTLDSLLQTEVKKRIELLNALQEKPEFASAVPKLQSLEARCDSILAEISRSIGRSTLHDNLKKVRSLVKCVKSDLASFLFYIIRDKDAKDVFDPDDLRHKSMARYDKSEALLSIALNFMTVSSTPDFPTPHNSDLLLENKSAPTLLLTSNDTSHHGPSHGPAYGTVSEHVHSAPAFQDDLDQERPFGPNPFFGSDRTARVPPTVAGMNTNSGIYQAVRAAAEEHWVSLHAILFQVGDFVVVLGRAQDLSLLGDVVVYSFANRLFCEILDRGIRLLKSLTSCMNDLQQGLKDVLKAAVAKKQKLDTKWNNNRLKAQPYANSVTSQVEVALTEMTTLMQFVSGVRLEELAAKARHRMGALMDLGQTFCQSTSLICGLPQSELFSVAALDAELARSPEQTLRAQVTALYATHNPAKLAQVDQVLEAHKDDETRLWKKLELKYGREAVEEARTLPGGEQHTMLALPAPDDDDEVIYIHPPSDPSPAPLVLSPPASSTSFSFPSTSASASSSSSSQSSSSSSSASSSSSSSSAASFSSSSTSSSSASSSSTATTTSSSSSCSSSSSSSCASSSVSTPSSSSKPSTEALVTRVGIEKGWPPNIVAATVDTFKAQTLLLVSDLQQLDLEDWKGLGFTLGVRKALMEAVAQVEEPAAVLPSVSGIRSAAPSRPTATNVAIDPITGLIVGNVKDGRIALNPITNEICHVDDYTDLPRQEPSTANLDEEPADAEEYILSSSVWTKEQEDADNAFRERLQLFYSLFDAAALEDGTIDSHVVHFRGREQTCMEILNKRYAKHLLEEGSEEKAKAAASKAAASKALAEACIKVGDRVVVRSLTVKKQYNGLVGNVVQVCRDGRVAVKLLEGTKTIAVDPSNLLGECDSSSANGIWLDEGQHLKVESERMPDRGTI